MATFIDQALYSFDGTSAISTRVKRPDRYGELRNLLVTSSLPLITRGSGLSYCNASAHPQGQTILMANFNRILDFDSANGSVVVEAGMMLGDLLKFAISRGLYVPVLPGHPCISVGGSIAFDVHGKSQTHSGSFACCVERLWLLHPNYGELVCSPTENSHIFELSLGGLGLTGLIIKAQLKLSRLKGNVLLVEKHAVSSLDEAQATMNSLKGDYDNVYSWNNLNLRGDKFGAGFVYAEKFVQSSEETRDIVEFNTLDKLAPSFRTRSLRAWNSITIPWMCRIYGLKEALAKKQMRLGLLNGSFPINGKEIYFNFFGRRGFREYQLITDLTRWSGVVDEIRNLIKHYNMPVSLGSLKLFNGPTRYLRFAKQGLCLSIDVAADNRSLKFFDQLDQIMISNQCLVNISKDSRLNKQTVATLYPEYAVFCQHLAEYDPTYCFKSELSDRLGITSTFNTHQ
jgi:hypothetical protein